MKEDLKDLYLLLIDSFKFFFEILKAGEFSEVKANEANKKLGNQLLNTNTGFLRTENTTDYATDSMYSSVAGNAFNDD